MGTEVKQRIEHLRKEIRRHDRLYYVLNQPEISDQQYDKLFAELREYEREHPDLIAPDSPTQRVSERPLHGFESVRHENPMLSIDNTYNADELHAFDDRVAKGLKSREFDYVVELKIDGLAISLRYEKCRLLTAATRGDGERGDNVTANVRTIKAVPLSLPGDGHVPDILEVRGEVYMPRSSFARLNELRTEAGEPLFANPRNAAAGSLKLLDARITATRNLSFFAYSVGAVSASFADDHYEALQKLKSLGFPVNPHIIKANDIDQVIKLCQKWHDNKSKLEYQIDGMVIKVNRFDQRDRLGATGRAPRWCISYKFPAQQAQTVVESIDVQVGKSGILTPVANLQQVLLAGTTVKRASLHNFDELRRLDVRPGDTVIIEKAGEIIPQVMEVKKDLRPLAAMPFEIPEKCPDCHGQVQKDDNGVYLRCVNPGCSSQLKERLKYFSGRDQMDIENLGTALIEQLVEKGLVKSFADLYKLEKHQLACLERMAEKSARNVIDGIEKSRTQPLWRLIAGLGIRHVGSQTAQILAEHFDSFEAIRNADEQTLSGIDQIGPTMAKSIYEYFRSNGELLDELMRFVQPKHDKIQRTGKLGGKTFVVTGTLVNFSREQIEEIIKENGGKISSSVSKNTDYLIAGEKAGSKLDKAEKLGIEVLGEDQFIKMFEI
ncbi:MAG: NAD-dependent DNA ligase LigA [Candidatus Brocadiia bacterium]|nr:MAG: NAD-dependent DNA ligase LigA [Candidatus Brocadiia bacterium]